MNSIWKIPVALNVSLNPMTTCSFGYSLKVDEILHFHSIHFFHSIWKKKKIRFRSMISPFTKNKLKWQLLIILTPPTSQPNQMKKIVISLYIFHASIWSYKTDKWHLLQFPVYIPVCFNLKYGSQHTNV